jgi:hypothetical protein
VSVVLVVVVVVREGLTSAAEPVVGWLCVVYVCPCVAHRR